MHLRLPLRSGSLRDNGENMKKRASVSTILFVLLFLIGLAVMLYPTVSDFLNSISQSRSIDGYKNDVALMNRQDYEKILKEARQYNEALLNNSARFQPTEEDIDAYNAILDVGGTGIMGYIEIPKINVYLPIYHGVSESVLEIGVGHIEGSSFPIGGIGTHAILSGHRGLPSSLLFTDLDKIKTGDCFIIRVLDETLTYEVCDIQTVEPSEVEALAIDPDKDLCTLVTCTPYGVNSHRLLVTGKRIENAVDPAQHKLHITADAVQVDTLYVAPVLGAPIMLVFLSIILLRAKAVRKKSNPIKDKEDTE